MGKPTRYKGIKKLGDGVYHVRVTATDPRTGKRREKRGTVKGAIEEALAVREQLRAALAGHREGPSAKRRKVGEYAQSWIRRKVYEVAPTTCDRYAAALEQHILPHLGDFYYDALTREGVQGWVNRKLGEGYKVDTVKSWFRIVTTMTRDAIAEMGLPRDPTMRIRFPESRPGSKSEAVTPAELERFLTAVREDFPEHYGLIMVLAFTGLRFCHASALKWEDWDETRGVLHIRRSQVRGKVSSVRRRKDAPKYIPVIPRLADALTWHRERMQGQGSEPVSGWMFPTGVGTLRGASSVQRAFRDSCKRAGITVRFSPHGLRYTFTDTLRFAQIDPIVRRELTGHHTERMQANYSTIRLDEHRQALDRMAEVLDARCHDEPPEPVAPRVVFSDAVLSENRLIPQPN